MMVEVKVFQKILKLKHPTFWNRVNINVIAHSNYQQNLVGLDGRIRAELNYNSLKYEIVISFPGNSCNLYPDISFYIRFVWGCHDVIATFDSDGTNHFTFDV